jgi:hypothetical protein
VINVYSALLVFDSDSEFALLTVANSVNGFVYKLLVLNNIFQTQNKICVSSKIKKCLGLQAILRYLVIIFSIVKIGTSGNDSAAIQGKL